MFFRMKGIKFVLLHAVLVAGLVLPAQAALESVSGVPDPLGDPNLLTEVLAGGNPREVAVSLANGLPVWYQDEDGRKLQLCLDTTLEVAPGVVVNPCEYEPPLINAPPSFPGNFGAEAIYWSAAALGTFTSTGGISSSALLVLALEATGANEGALVDGNQAAFSRIRIRIDVPVAGTYRVTHPFGARDYVVTIPGGRAINQTQDFGLVGLNVAQNFLVAMNDAAAPPVEPEPFSPAIDAGIVNPDGATIGPFLVPANPHGGIFNANNPDTFAGGPITVGGVTYIGLPFAPNPANPTVPIDVFQPVTGSPFGTNFFSIELLNPQGDFQLNPGNLANPQLVQFDNFLVIGKVFNDGDNEVPLAAEDTAGTASGRTANIDVVLNDTDVIAEGNTHGIAPQAIAVADANGPFLNVNGMPMLTATFPTTAGGTVRRVTSIPTGKATFLYSPPVGYFGPDSFQYVVQDAGGLTSAPATVSISVEDLRIDRADYRARTGKWHLRGTSSDSLDNAVTLFAGPRARLTPDQEVQTPAVSSDARGNATLRVSESSIEFVLSVDPPPPTAITAAHIHVGEPGQNGPIIFSLFESGLNGGFASPRAGTLTAVNLQTRPANGIGSFSDAINAILAGNAYVNVHTTAFPAGEIRGHLRRPVIGSAAVVDGTWEFYGHSTASPGSLPGVSVESGNAVRLLGTPLRLR